VFARLPCRALTVDPHSPSTPFKANLGTMTPAARSRHGARRSRLRRYVSTPLVMSATSTFNRSEVLAEPRAQMELGLTTRRLALLARTTSLADGLFYPPSVFLSRRDTDTMPTV